LVLRKIIEIVATKCHILSKSRAPAKIEFDFCWSSAPDPAGGAYSAPPDSKLDLRGPTSKGTLSEQNLVVNRRKEYCKELYSETPPTTQGSKIM